MLEHAVYLLHRKERLLTKEESIETEASTKTLSLAPAVTALLKPTTEYLGLELRDYVKNTIQGLKKNRREKNIDAHISAVQSRLSEDPVPEAVETDGTLAQLTFFEEWIDCVQEVDPEDEELSEIWEELLAQAARGKKHSPEIIRALKSLTPREAKFLLEIRLRAPSFPLVSGLVKPEDRYLAKSLEQRSILERDYAFAGVFIASLGLSLAALYFVFAQTPFPLEPPVLVVTAGAVLASSSFLLRAGMARWRMTWLGRELVSTSKRNGGRESGNV